MEIENDQQQGMTTVDILMQLADSYNNKRHLEASLILLKSRFDYDKKRASNKVDREAVNIQQNRVGLRASRFFAGLDSDDGSNENNNEDYENLCTKIKQDGNVCAVEIRGRGRFVESEDGKDYIKDKRPPRCKRHKYTREEDNTYISQWRIKRAVRKDEQKAKCDAEVSKLRAALERELKDLEEKYEKNVQINKLEQAQEESLQQQYLSSLPDDLANQMIAYQKTREKLHQENLHKVKLRQEKLRQEKSQVNSA